MDSSLFTQLAHTADQQLDAQGLACPLPLLKAKLALQSLEIGQKLLVIASDPGSWDDLFSYTQLSEHQMLERHEQDQRYYFLIEKG
ncbi:sulfurtransferase TusA family protein [Marinospirillum sp. MEB164]|uniref:Sulfurtransferase TusA family protein n=1 Tax=Marinospirillum alkalitolerans TaxID=3123374 RepID=A0ABW8PTN1_9GAMM